MNIHTISFLEKYKIASVAANICFQATDRDEPTILNWEGGGALSDTTEVGVPYNNVYIYMHSRRSLLFDDGKAWVKLNKSANFDVVMGSYDGAEVCELVGVFILNELSKQLPKQAIGLYRDDGLAILRNASGPDTEREKKAIVKVFKKFDLKITIDTNLKVTNFLDVTFDLETGSYKPFRKPGDDPSYINASSNHPSSEHSTQHASCI